MEGPNRKYHISNKSQSPKFEKNLFGHLKLDFGVENGLKPFSTEIFDSGF